MPARARSPLELTSLKSSLDYTRCPAMTGVYTYITSEEKKIETRFFPKKKKGEEELYLLFEKRNSIFEI